MGKVNIFVEGWTDKLFLEAMIRYHFPSKPQFQIYELEGRAERLSEDVHSNRLEEGLPNLIIVDSDYNNDDTIAQALKASIVKEAGKGNKLIYHSFFIEENLEDLARKIAPSNKETLWDCISGYAECNAALKDQTLREVDPKAKVFIYVNAHKALDKSNKLAFSNSQIWDLEHTTLNPLIEFLKTHLS